MIHHSWCLLESAWLGFVLQVIELRYSKMARRSHNNTLVCIWCTQPTYALQTSGTLPPLYCFVLLCSLCTHCSCVYIMYMVYCVHASSTEQDRLQQAYMRMQPCMVSTAISVCMIYSSIPSPPSLSLSSPYSKNEFAEFVSKIDLAIH
jgi:hypothetical protein